MLSVRRNRAKTFIATLEVLREATDELIAQVRHCEVEPYDEAKTNQFGEEHGAIEEVLSAFDDAVEFLPGERNAYIEMAEMDDVDELVVQFKKRTATNLG